MSHCKLDNFAKLHAFEFLNESEEAVRDGIVALKEFISSKPELDQQSISNETLVYFLRASKYRIEKAQKKIKR